MSSPADACDLKQMKVNSISLGDDERNLEIGEIRFQNPITLKLPNSWNEV